MEKKTIKKTEKITGKKLTSWKSGKIKPIMHKMVVKEGFFYNPNQLTFKFD